MTGQIFDIQKFSIHDGPGIRTTVFVKGCPLRCIWCHNPESYSTQTQISFIPERCIGCGFCFERCPNNAHVMTEEGHVLDRSKCVRCGACAEKCYAEALEVIGKKQTVEEVLEEVLKDKPFYETSGGGMTISGGEPLLQIDFCEALFRRAKEEGLHNAIETSSFASFDCLERLLPFVDLWLCDLKEMDEEKHRQFTGVSNSLILENLRKLAEHGVEMQVRLPTIPGLNDTEERFVATAEFVLSLPNDPKVEIMPYHRLGEGKLKRLGVEPTGRAVAEAPGNDEINAWIDTLAGCGLTVLNEKQ